MFLVLLAALAACSGGRPEQPTALRATAGLAGPAFETVEVVVYDIPPGTAVAQVVLLDPEGREHAAPDLVASTSEAGRGILARPGLGIGAYGGSSSGINPFVTLGVSLGGGADPGRQSRRVAARIPIPDPESYRLRPAAWRIEVRYLDVTGTAQALRLPVPVPR